MVPITKFRTSFHFPLCNIRLLQFLISLHSQALPPPSENLSFRIYYLKLNFPKKITDYPSKRLHTVSKIEVPVTNLP